MADSAADECHDEKDEEDGQHILILRMLEGSNDGPRCKRPASARQRAFAADNTPTPRVVRVFDPCRDVTGAAKRPEQGAKYAEKFAKHALGFLAHQLLKQLA